MKIRVPEYFEKFRCIKGECQDTCCVGWEIAIDDEARAKYGALDCEIGREIAEKTQHGCFPLDENGRCAFLDGKGLCRIISTLGEGYLCDICREHPRYYGVGRDGIEGGIGLGCEAAARIILSLGSIPRIIEIERDVRYCDEDDFADISEYFRECLYRSIFSRCPEETAGVYTAYAAVADEAAFEVSTTRERVKIAKPMIKPIDEEALKDLTHRMLSILIDCEALSDEWCGLVKAAQSVSTAEIIKGMDEAKGLLYYFTHRYVREGVEDMSIGARILFALCSTLAVIAISRAVNSDEPLMRAAVAYSKNIEYSTDNVEFILDKLSEFL